MRVLLVLSLPLVVLATACGGGARAVAGKAESGTSAIVALDTKGNTYKVVPNADNTFELKLPTPNVVILFAEKGGELQTVRFAEKIGGDPVASALPDYQGTVQMGQLSTCDCNADGAEDEAAAEESPLEQIDTDGDGENNAADDDDDNDGTDDAEDSDDDGEDGDDADHDCDTDDDGTPDLAADDDDNDGVEDADDDHGGDADGDGVSDDDAEDDDNDGDGDDEDSDDDGDGEDDDAEDGGTEGEG
jgi:hypothetical protein